MTKTFLSLAIGLMLVSSSAIAEDKDYCDKVRARADADSMLLFSPSIQLQGIKFPAASPGVLAIGGNSTAEGYQLRGSLLWSPLNAYKGTQVLSLADKDCLQHSATSDAQNILEQVSDIGRAPAFEAEIEYLDKHQDMMQSIVSQMQKRLAIGNITITDLAVIQQSVAVLERKRDQSQGQLDLIKAKEYVKNNPPVVDVIVKLQAASMEFEKQTSKVRMLDPWTIDLSVGAVPPMGSGTSANWFGMVAVSYNFGGIVRGKDENKYLTARQHELNAARYELTDQLFRLLNVVRSGIISATDEIATIDKHLAELNATKNALVMHPDAPNVMSALSAIELQILDTESDRVFLDTMRQQLIQWK